MLKFVKFAELPVADQDRAVRFYTEFRNKAPCRWIRPVWCSLLMTLMRHIRN